MAVYLPQNILLGVSQRILVAANVCLSHSLILSLIEFGSNWWHKFIRWLCDYMEEGQRMKLANSRIIVSIAFSGCFKLQPIVSTTPFQDTIVHPLVDFLRSYLSRLRNLLVFLVYYGHADPYTVLAAWGSDIAPFLARWKWATTRCYYTGSTITKTTQLVPWSSTIVSIVVMHISWVWDESIEQGSEGSTFLGVMLLSVSTINTFTDEATMMRTSELKDEDIILGAYPYSLAINPLRDKSIIASSSYCVIVFTVGRLLRFSQFKLQSLILQNQLVGCSCSQNYTGNSCISVSYTLGIGSCSAATTKDFPSNPLPICQTAYISLCLGDNYRTIGEDFAMYLLYAMPMLQSATELYAHHYCVEYHLLRSSILCISLGIMFLSKSSPHCSNKSCSISAIGQIRLPHWYWCSWFSIVGSGVVLRSYKFCILCNSFSSFLAWKWAMLFGFNMNKTLALCCCIRVARKCYTEALQINIVGTFSTLNLLPTAVVFELEVQLLCTMPAALCQFYGSYGGIYSANCCSICSIYSQQYTSRVFYLSMLYCLPDKWVICISWLFSLLASLSSKLLWLKGQVKIIKFSLFDLGTIFRGVWRVYSPKTPNSQYFVCAVEGSAKVTTLLCYCVAMVWAQSRPFDCILYIVSKVLHMMPYLAPTVQQSSVWCLRCCAQGHSHFLVISYICLQMLICSEAHCCFQLNIGILMDLLPWFYVLGTKGH